MKQIIAPGLVWKRGKTSQTAIWRANKPARRTNYPVKHVRIWSGVAPSPAEIEMIAERCVRLDAEQREWVKGARGIVRSAENTKKGHVYFVKNGDLVKIGFTTNFAVRVKALQNGAGTKLEVLGFVPGTRDRERILHHEFRALRTRGEWFRLVPPLTDYIRGPVAEIMKRDKGRTGVFRRVPFQL